jgi:hypothetical protein
LENKTEEAPFTSQIIEKFEEKKSEDSLDVQA